MLTDINKIIQLEQGRKANALRVKEHCLQQLFWECTLKCNLKCKHCGSNCDVNDKREDMPLEDFIPVLDEIRSQLDNPILVITTGGEPLLRKDICECGREITNRGFYWGMVTNGTFLNAEMYGKLMDAGLKSISISIDGLRDTHYWMRQNSLSFDCTINAIDLIVSIPLRLTWNVITCVNQKNISQLTEMRNILIEHGVKEWKLFTVFPMGRAIDNNEMELTKEQYWELLDFIVEARKSNIIKVSYGCEGFLGPYEYEVRDNQYYCASGINVASILYDGSISGCLAVRQDFKQGNIYKDSFMEIWNNGFNQYRNSEWKRTGICTDCEVWRWCSGNGMHLRDEAGNLTLCNYRKLYY